MRPLLGKLVAKKLIVHEFPKRDSADRTGVLADAESPLVRSVPHFFEERVRVALGDYGRQVKFLSSTPSPVPKHVHTLLTGQRPRFVGASQEAARHFFGLPHSSRSEGLFCMLRFESDATPLIALVKLEYEEGTRARLAGAKGHRFYQIEHVVDLMLTKKTKLFKVALFHMPPSGQAVSDIEGRTCDYQAGPGVVADYFLRDFLGCEYVGRDDLLTQEFLNASESFINHRVTDPALKARYESAVLAELHSSDASLNPALFARKHLLEADRAAFLTTLQDREVPPTPFGKDTSLIARRIERITLTFGEHNISVSSPPDEIGRAVTITQDGDLTDLSVRAKLTSTKATK